MSVEAEKTTEISAQALLYRLRTGKTPYILDVRTEEDRRNWQFECRFKLKLEHISYIDFIEEPEESMAKIPKDQEILVVCNNGNSSRFVANMLDQQCILAYSIAGGMTAWGSLYRNDTIWEQDGKKVVQYVRVGKGCLSYILISDGEAAIIDPGRHVENYLSYLLGNVLKLRYVFDTHLHADHLSGARQLADATGASYLVSPEEMAGGKIRYEPLPERSEFPLGNSSISIRSVKAPGHTPGHNVYLFEDQFLFTGDLLFLNSLGRPDLGGKAAEWVGDLYNTVQKVIGEYDDSTYVLPTHTSGIQDMDEKGRVFGVLGDLRKKNRLVATTDKEEFTQEVLSHIPDEPEDYQNMRNANLGLLTPDESTKNTWETGRNLCAIDQASGH